MNGRMIAGPRDAVASDAALAVVVAAGSLAGHHLAAGADGTPGDVDWLGYLLLGLGAAALVARRHLPAAVLAVTTAGVVATLVLDVSHEGPFVILPVMVALYTATETGRRTIAALAAIAIVATFGLTVLLDPPPSSEAGWQGLLWATGWLTVAIVTGEVVRSRRAYLGEVEARAIEAERSRDEEGRRRAGEERLRIAREMHDVVGHSLSVINVQAGTAAHVIGRQPEKAHEALETIRETSKQALDELRRTLGALQQTDEAVPLAPAASLARLEDLTRPVQAAGVAVEVSVTGRARPLPAPVEQAGYRIVQESLTNVLRHAEADAATVRFDYGDHDLRIDVEDRGARVADRQRLDHGTGIAGMRERALAMGGELHVATPAGGGVRVHARLPLGGAR